MNKCLAAALTLLVIAGCMTPEQREARDAKREARRAEKQANRSERAAQEAATQEAQAQAQADAEAATQYVNIENLCTNISQAHAARCNTEPSATYLWCLGSSAPATISAVTWGETQRCHADIGSADCNVIASGVLPASCAQGTAPAEVQAAQPVNTDPGGVTVAKACDSMMEKYCSRCGDGATMPQCVQEWRTWCHNGRDGNQGTGMNKKQFGQCSKTYQGLKCTAIGTGYVPIDCPGLRG